MKKTFLLFMLLVSGCLIRAQVLTEDFEGGSDLPEGWFALSSTTSGNSSIAIQSYSGNTAAKCVKMVLSSSDAGQVLALASPKYDYTQNPTYKVSFYYKSYTTLNALELGFIADTSDLSTLQSYQTYTTSSNYNYYYGEAYVTPNAEGFLLFKATQGTIVFDDVVVEEVKPYSISVKAIPGVNNLPYDIEKMYGYVIQNTGLNTATVNLSVDAKLNTEIKDVTGDNVISSLELSSLAVDTVWVMVSTASANGIIEDSLKLTTTVAQSTDISLLTASAIYLYSSYEALDENFDAESKTPAHWEVANAAPSSSSYVEIGANSSAVSSPNCARLTADEGVFLALVSPQLKMDEFKYKVSFHMYQGYGGTGVDLGTMTDPDDASTFTLVEHFDGVNYSTLFLEAYVALDQKGYVAFRNQDGTIYLDDVKVDPVLPYNVTLENTIAHEVVLTGNESDFTFLVNNTGAEDATIDLTVSTSMDYKIYDKTRQSEIASIAIPALTTDTIIVSVTASAITEGEKGDTFDLEAKVSEATDVASSASIMFTTYTAFTEVETSFEDEALPFGWSIVAAEGDVKFYESDNYSHSGSCYAQLNAADDNSAENPTRLISPALKGFDGAYKMTLFVRGNDGNAEVGMVTDLNDWSTYTKLADVVGENYAYAKAEVEFPDFNTDGYIVIQFSSTSSYDNVRLDDIDIERYVDYAVDMEVPTISALAYVGQSVLYPVYVENKGKLEETYNIKVNSDWAYQVLDADSVTAINDITIAAGTIDTAYVAIIVPESGLMSGDANVAELTVECANNVENSEVSEITTSAQLYATFIDEDFEDLSDLPNAWLGVIEGYSSVKIYAYHPYEGNQCISMYQSSSSTQPAYLSTAMFKAAESSYSISFYAYVTSDPGQVMVGTLTDPHRFETLVALDTIDLSTEYKKYTVSGITLDEAKSFILANISSGKTFYIDNVTIEQESTSVTFDPVEGEELHIVSPDMFVSFSKPFMIADSQSITEDDLSDYIVLTKDSLMGEVIALSYELSQDMQTVKLTPVEALNDTHYYLAVKEGLTDLRGGVIAPQSVFFTVEDFFAPAFAKGYPALDLIAESYVTTQVQADETSNLYIVAVEKGATVPSVAEVKAGVDYSDVSVLFAADTLIEAQSSVTCRIDGLMALTAYDLYFVLEDKAGNIQDTVSALEVTTVDLTAPTFVEAYPAIDSVGETSIRVEVQTDEVATLYYMAILHGQVAPSVEELIAGEGFADVSVVTSGDSLLTATSPVALTLEGFEALSSYDLYFVLEDTSGNVQDAVVSLGSTTLDLTAPEFVDNYPVVDSVTLAEVYVTVSSTENGETHFILVENEAVAPTVEQVKAGVDYEDVVVLASTTVEVVAELDTQVVFQGLTPGAEYDIYVVTEDESANLTNVVEKLDVQMLEVAALNDKSYSALEVYPSPASHSITIAADKEMVSYVMLSISGQLVKHELMETNTKTIAVSDLERGLYMLVIDLADGQRAIKKIVLK